MTDSANTIVRRAVVTAGSTVGRLDAVRYTEQLSYLSETGTENRFILDSQNPFKGKLGLYIAEALHKEGYAVTLVARKDLLRGEQLELPDECIRAFYTFEDLEETLPRVLAEVDPDTVFMSAAVSDFVPTAIEGVTEAARDGKISSDLGELVVRYRATPKLIDRIRAAVRPETSIVGFKLVVGVSEEAMRAAAMKQLERADSQFCVVNDFRELSPDGSYHPVRVFSRSGELTKLDGTKREVAAKIVHHVERSA